MKSITEFAKELVTKINLKVDPKNDTLVCTKYFLEGLVISSIRKYLSYVGSDSDNPIHVNEQFIK